MTSGRIQSIDPDWRGDTLAADVDAADTVLTVKDTADFDEEETSERWLVIADSDPIAYNDVDDDAGTVTLATPAGADYEAGLPVNVWDPTVAPDGAKVLQYEATVMTDRGPVTATLDIEKIPFGRADLLVGASVALEETDQGEWFVSKVYAREAVNDATVTRFPGVKCIHGIDDPISDDTWTLMPNWFVERADRVTLDIVNHRFTVLADGEYDIRCGVTFSPGGDGRRGVRPHYWGIDGTDLDWGFAEMVGADISGKIGVSTAQVRPLLAGMSVSFEAYQNSGGTLDIRGAALFAPPLTWCYINWARPL